MSSEDVSPKSLCSDPLMEQQRFVPASPCSAAARSVVELRRFRTLSEPPAGGMDSESDDPPATARFADDAFGELQAILAGLAQHVVPEKGGRRRRRRHREASCESPASARSTASTRSASSVDGYTQGVVAALHRAALDYPQHAAELEDLVIVHATIDLVCLADHRRRRLFITIRGTDRYLRQATLPRDIGNDALVVLGVAPWRVRSAAAAYSEACELCPGYATFGTGHSLGATIVEWLARWAESSPERRDFERIDLFNPGSTPLRRRPVVLERTQVHAHCVMGDLVSRFYITSGIRRDLRPLPQLNPHLLGHFLPSSCALAPLAREVVAGATLRAMAAVCASQAATATIVAKAALAAERALRNARRADRAAQADALEGQPAAERHRACFRPMAVTAMIWRRRRQSALPNDDDDNDPLLSGGAERPGKARLPPLRDAGAVRAPLSAPACT